MNFKIIGRFIAQILAIELLFMLPALGISLGFGEWRSVQAFLCTIGLLGLIALVLYLVFPKLRLSFFVMFTSRPKRRASSIMAGK